MIDKRNIKYFLKLGGVFFSISFISLWIGMPIILKWVWFN